MIWVPVKYWILISLAIFDASSLLRLNLTVDFNSLCFLLCSFYWVVDKPDSKIFPLIKAEKPV